MVWGWPFSVYQRDTRGAHAPLLDREIACQRLKRLLLAGRLRPDQPLSERGLAARLCLGRMPVREALRALAAEALLRISRGRGAFVRTLGLDEVREVYETRQALDARIALSLRLTAEHRPARSREANGGHLEILAAVRRGDAEGAERRMREHLARAVAARAEILSGPPRPASSRRR